ncbi:MAG TPA: hypothetical protein VFV99_05200 [Kofleriaceae bacterium]|nr:hypothetical protein [Kofleriaceae bacterium]
MTRLLVVAALLAACSKGDSGPPCDKVVDHMMDLTKQMMPGHDPESLGERKQMIEQCKSRKYSAATRRCLLDAKSFNDLATCQTRDQKTSTPTPPAPPEQPAPTPQAPAPAPPAGSGSSS